MIENLLLTSANLTFFSNFWLCFKHEYDTDSKAVTLIYKTFTNA